eukprot:jgi/Botrbrau1/1871/Bobra.146_1s0058.1
MLQLEINDKVRKASKRFVSSSKKNRHLPYQQSRINLNAPPTSPLLIHFIRQ